MNSIFTKDYQNKKIVPILKEYSAKKYGRRREFVDAETRARLGLGIDEAALPETPSPSEVSAPTDQPSAPTDQPSAPTDQPSAPTDQPSAPTDQPSTPTEQPST
ncbi:MAG: hypothetical protein LBD75_07485 [Candidatus Peribacteria bacterium]|jgi:hypothetical protein|nr:hypothetical protein [Candidatus Peribacteria bacterium]